MKVMGFVVLVTIDVAWKRRRTQSQKWGILGEQVYPVEVVVVGRILHP
jgi:hypothetical protein